MTPGVSEKYLVRDARIKEVAEGKREILYRLELPVIPVILKLTVEGCA